MEWGPELVHNEREDMAGANVEDWIGIALHDLCQPLTALECQLFLGSLDPDTNAAPDGMRETIRTALVQCGRMRMMVRNMQNRMCEFETAQGEQA